MENKILVTGLFILAVASGAFAQNSYLSIKRPLPARCKAGKLLPTRSVIHCNCSKLIWCHRNGTPGFTVTSVHQITNSQLEIYLILIAVVLRVGIPQLP